MQHKLLLLNTTCGRNVIVKDQWQYRFGIDSKFSNFVLEGKKK